jgi:hypothetical protein
MEPTTGPSSGSPSRSARARPIGPLLLSLGASDNGSVQLHFALSRPIPEGTLLDRLH